MLDYNYLDPVYTVLDYSCYFLEVMLRGKAMNQSLLGLVVS